MRRFRLLLAGFIFVLVVIGIYCSNLQKSVSFSANFDDTHDRIWIGEEFWSIPLEDWRVRDGRIECIGNRPTMRVNLLTYILKEQAGDAEVSVSMGLLDKENDGSGSAGFRLGIYDQQDNDVRAHCYFGQGIDAIVHTSGKLRLGDQTTGLPQDFDLSAFGLILKISPQEDAYSLELTAKDGNQNSATVAQNNVPPMRGLLALVNQRGEGASQSPHFWFDDWRASGSKLQHHPENAFGPILWSMYTLSRNVLKMTAQMPPLNSQNEQQVELQIEQNGTWETVGKEKIDPDARTATFRISDWDDSQNIDYRLVYDEPLKEGQTKTSYYEGTIQRNPVDRPLRFGALTCQHGSGFPYTPVRENLAARNLDLLYFSGDQIYEGNGGYGIIRFPADESIVNYLGKWYMFGWAFGEIMRDRPTICTPDDHDVFQGNLWGEGGKNMTKEEWQQYRGAIGGYVQPAEMVNAVHRTQCAHLPDPYDPAPIKQDISVWYTDLLYGRMSFAIISDRIFKTGPTKVAFWSGRPDHLRQELPNVDAIDSPELHLIGERQRNFLQHWVRDWKGADMKVLLSQTILTNAATHHGGNKDVLAADLDSGGWPIPARNETLDLIRKAFAFHIAGDQHLPTLIHYGIDDFKDAGWAFCNPAIYVGYERRFLPEKLGMSKICQPEHGLPNTGCYRDGFGNPNFVYAVGNPVWEPVKSPRYQRGQEKSSGFGEVEFDQQNRTITVKSWRFLADMQNPDSTDQFPGWPHTIHQLDNYGRKATDWLPDIKVNGLENPVVEIINENTGELVMSVRINGTDFSPKVFSREMYTIRVGNPDQDVWQTQSGVKTIDSAGTEQMRFDF